MDRRKEDDDPLLSCSKQLSDRNPEISVYKRRWWVTTVFCFIGVIQSLIWNTWGPIAESTEIIFSWTDGNIATLSNLPSISFVVLVIPVCMLMDTQGLRLSALLCTLVLVVCTTMRCFTLDPVVFTPLAYVSAFLQGIAGTVPFSGPAAIASVWFPPQQRPAVTAVVYFFSYFGISMSFIVGPRLVPNPRYAFPNASYPQCNYNSSGDQVEQTSFNCENLLINAGDIKSGIRNLMFLHAGMSVIAFVLTLIYFPAKPPKPPSATASLDRISYKRALFELVKKGHLWLISLAASFSIGVAGVWIAFFDVVVKPLGVSQIDAGWIGFWHTLTGSMSGIFIAKCSVLFSRHRKILFIIFFFCAALCAAWVALICDGSVKFNLKHLYASTILLGIFIKGPGPLFYEVSAETAFPVGEGVTGGFYTLINNLTGVILLTIASLNLGTSWLTWTLFGFLLFNIPMLIVFQERYRRTDIDEAFTVSSYAAVSK